MNQKIRILNNTLWVLGTVFALTLGLSSVASAQAPAGVSEYVGSSNTKFRVSSCGHTTTSSEALVKLSGSGDEGDTCFGIPCGEGTWAVTVENSGNFRLAGVVDSTSRNGRKLYLNFFEDTRNYLLGSFLEAKGDLCEITPSPDQVLFTQAAMKMNKMGTKVQVRFRAKYGAIVNDGGRLKPAQWRFTSNAVLTY